MSTWEGTLAPPGECGWTCASFGPPESTTQTANWSVEPFFAQLMAECRRVHWRHLANTIELVLLSSHPSPQSKRQIDRFSHFCTTHCRKPYTLQWATLSPKLPLLVGDLDHRLIHDSFSQSEPTIQTTSQLVQLFSHRWPQSGRIFYNRPLLPLPPSKLPLPVGAPGSWCSLDCGLGLVQGIMK